MRAPTSSSASSSTRTSTTFALGSTSAVSGFYFGHRDSNYFGVAKIARDQLEDYAGRRGVSIEQAERWLRPNLE
jgi:5-methyltetrahydrofolate--homocysteine methyltransferase